MVEHAAVEANWYSDVHRAPMMNRDRSVGGSTPSPRMDIFAFKLLQIN